MCTSITLVRTMGTVNNNEFGLASQMSKQSFMGGRLFVSTGRKKTAQPTKACWERWCVFSSECQIQLLTRIGCSCSCPVGRVAPLLLNLQKVVLRQCLLPHTSQVLWRLCTLPLVVFTFGTPPHIDHAVKNDVPEIRAADDTWEFNISRLG